LDRNKLILKQKNNIHQAQPFKQNKFKNFTNESEQDPLKVIYSPVSENEEDKLLKKVIYSKQRVQSANHFQPQIQRKDSNFVL
jgi:hypothetical protein